tara:strand:- start:2701 stop:3483 length:783 start_codon:yes stop_codon:yes gene_type:complete
MCLAIYKPKHKKVNTDRLRNGFNRNPHGSGIAYSKNGKVFIKKGFFSFSEFYKAYKSIGEKHAMLIHFRWATKGGKTKENCHPFKLNQKHAMVHNGTIDRVLCKNNGSDSSNFAHRILAPIIKENPSFIYSKAGKKMINLAIGQSKVAVIDGSGEAVIFNEQKGHWDEGCWFSNDSYMPRVSKWKNSLAPKYSKKKVKPAVHSQEVLFKDYHASNRSKGRSYIDDLEEDVRTPMNFGVNDFYDEEDLNELTILKTEDLEL